MKRLLYSTTGIALVTAALASLLPGPDARAGGTPRLAVLPLAGVGVDARVSAVLTDILVADLAERGRFQVLGMDEVNALLGLDKLKTALGCDELACALELGGALGTELMVSGNVARLGSSLSIKLALFDTQAMRVLNRVRESVPADEDRLEAALTAMIVRLLAVLPAPATGAAPVTPASSSSSSDGTRTAGIQERVTPEAAPVFSSLAPGAPAPAGGPRAATSGPAPTDNEKSIVLGTAAPDPGLSGWQVTAIGSTALSGAALLVGSVLAKLAADQSTRITNFARAASSSAPYPDPYPYEAYLADRQRFERLRLGADLAFGVGAAALALGLGGWFVFDDRGGDAAASASLSALPAVRPALGPTGLALDACWNW